MCDIMCKVVTVRVMFFSDMCVCALRHIYSCALVTIYTMQKPVSLIVQKMSNRTTSVRFQVILVYITHRHLWLFSPSAFAVHLCHTHTTKHHF